MRLFPTDYSRRTRGQAPRAPLQRAATPRSLEGVWMRGTYNPWLVCLSVLVAILVSYTALNLAVRVSGANRRFARLWFAGGAIAMGGGIWSMHFIGMLAFSLPILLAYDVTTTLQSLAIAVA